MELIYQEVLRPFTVLIKVTVPTNPNVPREVTVLMVDSACEPENEEREDKFINPRLDNAGAIVLTVLGLVCNVLSLASRVAELIYPRFPKPAEKSAGTLESSIAPRLQIAVKNVVDKVDITIVFV